LYSDVALARIRAHGLREHANADVELRRRLIEHRLHDRGHARHHDYIADPEARRPRHLVEGGWSKKRKVPIAGRGGASVLLNMHFPYKI
jgi:hypothetical protein